MSSFLDSLKDGDKIKVSVYDNSKNPYVPPLPYSNKIGFVCPIFASKGKGRQFQVFSDLSDLYSEHGEDLIDIKKYGQQGANAVHALMAGAKVYAMRMLPTDAKCASAVLQVWVKEEASIPQYQKDDDGYYLYDGDTNEKVPIMIENPDGEGEIQQTLPGYKIKLVAVEGSENGKTDSNIVSKEGWKVYPILKFSSYKEGSGGNNLGFSILNDYSRDKKVTDGRRYYFEFVESTTSGTLDVSSEYIQFSFNPDAKLSKTSSISEFIEEVYQNLDETRGYNYRDMILENYSENYLELLTHLSDRFNQSQNSDFDIDIITCTDTYGQPYDTLILDEDSIQFIEGGERVFLMGGHEGSLQEGNTVKNAEGGDVVVTKEMVEETKRNLLKQTFQFKVDKRLSDCRKVGGGIILDANYDSDIKKLMGSTLIDVRQDLMCFFDCGITSNMQEAIAVSKDIKSSVNCSLYNHAIFPHCGKAKDLKLNSTVTQTYEVAYTLPYIYSTHGNFSIVCSYQTGLIRTMLLDWVVEGFDEEKTIEKYNLCYATDLGDVTGNATRYSEKKYHQIVQKTLYNDELSVLKNLRNAMVITDQVRLCKTILIKYVNYTEGADEAMANGISELKNLTSRYPSNISFEYSGSQTERDKILRNGTIAVGITFPNEIETFNVNITANRSE